MIPVPPISGLDLAFGNINHLPKFDDLPEEFQRERSPFCKIAQTLFFKGGRLSDHGMRPKEGVNAGDATAAISAILVSFKPNHEHKIAGTGFLISEWFEFTPLEDQS